MSKLNNKQHERKLDSNICNIINEDIIYGRFSKISYGNVNLQNIESNIDPSKVLQKIILDRLNSQVESILSDEQACFQ